MLEGLLSRQAQVITYSYQEVRTSRHLLDDMEEHCPVQTLHIHLLGDFVLLVNDTPIRNLDVPRLQSLLAYLALHRGVPLSRSRIAFALWPDSTDAQAHTNLRNLLFKLRLTLPEVDTFLKVEHKRFAGGRIHSGF